MEGCKCWNEYCLVLCQRRVQHHQNDGRLGDNGDTSRPLVKMGHLRKSIEVYEFQSIGAVEELMVW